MISALNPAYRGQRQTTHKKKRNMNAVKLLGSLLSNNATGGSIGQQVLSSVLSGSSSGGKSPLGALLGGGGGGGGGALGAILGAAMGNKGGGGGGGMAGQLLGSLLGGGQRAQQASGAAGLLGGLLGGGGQQQQSSGGVGDLLGGLLGGGGSGGGAGGLLGSILGGGQQQPEPAPRNNEIAGLLGRVLGVGSQGNDDEHAQLQRHAEKVIQAPPAAAQNEATILIKAMLNAAKADGRFDDDEKEKVLGRLGEVDQSEVDFIRKELATPLDVQAFVREVPRGLEQQTYAFSVMGINLDTQNEAQYLGQLAQGLGLDAQECNEINSQLGAPTIFR